MGGVRDNLTPKQRQELRRAVYLDVKAAREDPNAFIEFAGRSEGNRRMSQGEIHREWQDHLSANQYAIVRAPVGAGKAIDLEEEIPTPDRGWVKMRDIHPGDLVFDRYGKPTRVVAESPVFLDHRVYEVEFADGAKVVADADHRWVVRQSQGGRGQYQEIVKTTHELAEDTLYTGSSKAGSSKWRVPSSLPAQYPERDLPIHPYVLGAWLGDGTSENSAITCHLDDIEVLDRCIELEGGVCGLRRQKPGTRVVTQCVGGATSKKGPTAPRLRNRLGKLGLLGNKHVPDQYLQSSVEQRRALLAGLMDTDGTVSAKCPHLEFCSMSKALAEGVYELAHSLGFPARLFEGRASLNGKDVGTKYRVIWTSTEPVFWLERKRVRHASTGGGMQASYRSIRKVSPVPTRPVKCISVEADNHTYLVGRSYTVTHNSTQLRLRIVWELGRNPNLRVAIISAAKEANPKKFLDAIKNEITNNPRVHMVFPKLKPQLKPKNWAQLQCTVERADASPDPSIQTFGLDGNILGSRLDLIILDDVHNIQNTLTEASRDKIFTWISSEVTSRGPQDGSVRIWCIGHRWHKRDALERLEKESGYKAINYSAFVEDPETGEERSLIPHIMSLSHLKALEKKLGVLAGPMLRNRLTDLDNARFKQEWFEKCLRAGRGLELVKKWNPMDAPTFCGVDLSTGGLKGDASVFFTFCVLPDGSRRVLDIRKGQWRAPTILENAVDVHNRYGCLFFVESTGQQQLFIDFANDLETLPIKKFHTGMNKWSVGHGVESLALEMCNGYWVIPGSHTRVNEDTGKEETVDEPHPLIEEWISEMMSFVPDPKEHTGDILMASWFARECARQSGFSHEGWDAEDEDDSFFDVDTLRR